MSEMKVQSTAMKPSEQSAGAMMGRTARSSRPRRSNRPALAHVARCSAVDSDEVYAPEPTLREWLTFHRLALFLLTVNALSIVTLSTLGYWWVSLAVISSSLLIGSSAIRAENRWLVWRQWSYELDRYKTPNTTDTQETP